MSGVLASVDQRTKLVGENRLELLMFRLHGKQLFAINVFKVHEVLKLANLTEMPQQHSAVCGVTAIREKTVPVINLSQAIGMPPLPVNAHSTLVVTEYNRSVQAFMVGGVERIINLNWEEVSSPPATAGRHHYLTAITKYRGEIVEVIDVEKVLSQITPISVQVSEEIVSESTTLSNSDKFVMLVDDSTVALQQVAGTVERLGLESRSAPNGLKALNMLLNWAKNEPAVLERCLMVITDAEMPEMDGYRLTTEIRKHPALAHLHVVMHTSLSGRFNLAMTKKVGCDGFLSKFNPDELAKVVMDRLKESQQ